jgi:dihydrofolate reductase
VLDSSRRRRTIASPRSEAPIARAATALYRSRVTTCKYVASTTLESPEWQNTTVLEGNISEAVSRLKQEDGETITLNGSATLLRTLLAAGLVDELVLFLHPVVLGAGSRLFADGQGLGAITLADCHPYTNGVVSLTYRPTAR